MGKTFRTQGAGASQTLHEIEDEKIPVYDTQSDAEADLANLAEGQIVATKDAGTDEQTLIEYVDGRLETTEVNIPITGVSLTCKARKSGNTVNVVFIPVGSDLVVPYASTTTIGTLPEGYRPVRTEEFTIGARVVSSTDDVATYPPRVRFDADGTIAIRDWNPTASVTLNSPFNTFTFLVDGTNSHGMTVNTLKDAKDYTDAQLAGKVTERNITSTAATSTMDYFAAIKAILDNTDFSTWENKTYAGKFTSNGQAPHQWNGTYQLSKVSDSPYGNTIMGNANNRSFTGIWENATNGWKIIMDGETLVYNNNGLLVTSSENNRRFRFVCNRAPFNLVGAQLQAYNLWGRQALGRVGMEMNTNLTYQDVDLLTLTNNTYNWPAGNTFWWSNPTFQPTDTSASVWPMYAQNDNHFYRIELWGIAWDQSYVSGGFEFVL